MLLCFSVYQIKAQQPASLKGTLKDTTDFKSVAYAGVMVINPTDSTLIKFTHATDKGAFVLTNLPPIKLRFLALLITKTMFY